jgi:hypothetical protein
MESILYTPPIPPLPRDTTGPQIEDVSVYSTIRWTTSNINLWLASVSIKHPDGINVHFSFEISDESTISDILIRIIETGQSTQVFLNKMYATISNAFPCNWDNFIEAFTLEIYAKDSYGNAITYDIKLKSVVGQVFMNVVQFLHLDDIYYTVDDLCMKFHDVELKTKEKIMDWAANEFANVIEIAIKYCYDSFLSFASFVCSMLVVLIGGDFSYLMNYVTDNSAAIAEFILAMGGLIAIGRLLDNARLVLRVAELLLGPIKYGAYVRGFYYADPIIYNIYSEHSRDSNENEFEDGYTVVEISGDIVDLGKTFIVVLDPTTLTKWIGFCLSIIGWGFTAYGVLISTPFVSSPF